jgi:hypothetical protein
MRQLWEDAAAAYFEPARFQLSLQNCITVSRTVTFILQSNKDQMEGFDAWYEQQRSQWAGDPIMRWARDARNSIEKQGDLKTHSQVRGSIIAGYLDGPETKWMPQALFSSPQQIYRSIPSKFFIPHVIENGTLLIERRWVDSELPSIEVLEALAHVYGQFADTIVDYLRVNRLKLPPWLADTRPDAMGALAMDRALYLSMNDGSITGHRFYRKPMEKPDAKVAKKALKRYGPDAGWKRLREARSLRELAEIYFEKARIVIARDGFHRSLGFFLKGSTVIQMISTDHPDRASRYVLMRDLAKLARTCGADGVMLIGEAWTVFQPNIPKSGFAADAPDRGEAIVLHAANAAGEALSLQALFERKRPGSKKIRHIEPTMLDEDTFQFLLYPFLREWDCVDQDKVKTALDQVEALGVETPVIGDD